MKQRVSSVFVSLLCISLSVIFSLQFFAVNASAEVEITKVSALTGRSFFGDTIPATYYLSGQPTSFNFEYFGSYTSPGVGLNVDSSSIIPTPAGMAQYDFVMYKGVGLPWNLVVDVSVNDFYLRFGDYARGGFALSTYLNSGVTSSWNSAISYPDNYCGSFGAVRADSGVTPSLADYYGIMYFQFMSGYSAFNFRPIYYSFDEGGVMDELKFSGIYPYYDSSSDSGAVYLIVICPYIGSSMSGDPPAETTTSTETSSPSSGTTVVVDVDMTETNSLLGQIKQAILGIVDGITNALKDLFIPDEEFLDDFQEDMLGTDQEPGFLEEHLGGLYQAIEAIGRIFDEFPDAVAATSIDIPACQIPLAGETLTLGPYSVPLIVEGLPQIFYDGLKFIIDFLCVAAFLNMCRNKLEIFLNPDSEVVQNDS